MRKDAEVVLRAGLAELHLSLSDDQVRDLLYFQNLIGKWNKVYNLTAVREQAEMLTHHLLDSLAAVEPLQKYLQGRGLSAANLLDVGSGAGLPGVVLAICFPTLAVTCVDTVGKKAAFIKHVALALGLSNLTGLHARVETITQPFDVICSRAFASLSDLPSGRSRRWPLVARGWRSRASTRPKSFPSCHPMSRCFTWNRWPCPGWRQSAASSGFKRSVDRARPEPVVNSKASKKDFNARLIRRRR